MQIEHMWKMENMKLVQIGDYGCVYDTVSSRIGNVRLIDTFFDLRAIWIEIDISDVPKTVIDVFERHEKMIIARNEVETQLQITQ